MLDRTRDAHRHVQLRRHDLAGLAHLVVVRHETRIDCCTRGAQRCVQPVRERLEHLRVVLATAQPSPARHDDLRRGQLRPVQLRHFAAYELRQARIGCRFDLLDRRAAAFCCNRVETGRTYRDDLDRVSRLHRRDRVTRVDRALERVGAVYSRDVADLRDVQLRGDARRDVLATGSRRREDVRIVLRDVQHRRCDVFRQARFELRRVGQQHLAHARDLRCRVRRALRVVARHQHVNITADLLCRSDRVQRRRLDRCAVVLCYYQIRHFVRLLRVRDQSTLASVFSFSTSVFTSATLTPALRFGGSTTFSVFRRGVTSTPRSSGLSVSSGFFFAFMMLGSVT
ncbi:hypothetical protein R69919_03226 [Paraburkholderia gardini]|nr:hypothetical protein R69919_03226 [Paraburkholderia gardini]